ncbi:MAG TPA: hypothetical protein VMB03_18855 [Bryobacteraceae bacterium]|nr:hypothetical protein [Bryobacteraceae bacterium]
MTKKVFSGLAAAAGLVAIGAMAPPAAKAIASAAVTIVNSSSQPVPGADVERLARIPYESSVQGANCPAPGNVGVCFYTFAAVPVGYRLVVENLAGYFQVSPGATAPLEGYIENSSFRIKSSFAAPLGQIDNGGHIQAAFNTPTRFYIDANENTFAVASSNWSNGNSEMVLSGYLENCSITGCPAVQH